MKERIEIRAEIRKLESSLVSLKDRYTRMHQIDLMSGDGSRVRTEMHNIQGQIDALNWVLDKNDKVEAWTEENFSEEQD